MEIYKGMSTFAGIAIGKIFYYNRAEYQLSQYLINNVKYELTRFEQAKDQVLKDLQHQLKMADQEEQKEDLQHQISVLSMGSFEKAVESMIKAEKVSAVYAVMTTKEELSATFASLEDPAVKEQIRCVRQNADHLITVLGGVLPRIDLGKEPVIHGDMCLGEGTGAIALCPFLDMGATLYNTLSTFDDIHVDQYEELN